MDRVEKIRKATFTDRSFLAHTPSCNTTHGFTCDCQVQRYIKEKIDLLATIDQLRKEKKEIQDALYKATRATSTYEDMCELEKLINKDRIP